MVVLALLILVLVQGVKSLPTSGGNFSLLGPVKNLDPGILFNTVSLNVVSQQPLLQLQQLQLVLRHLLKVGLRE